MKLRETIKTSFPIEKALKFTRNAVYIVFAPLVAGVVGITCVALTDGAEREQRALQADTRAMLESVPMANEKPTDWYHNPVSVNLRNGEIMKYIGENLNSIMPEEAEADKPHIVDFEYRGIKFQIRFYIIRKGNKWIMDFQIRGEEGANQFLYEDTLEGTLEHDL